MQQGLGRFWRGLRWPEKGFLVLAAVYALQSVSGVASGLQPLVAFAGLFLGLLALIGLVRRALQRAIWRLRNRLVVSYLFIGVVPILLILALVGIASYLVIGQMAVYLVNTELSRRISFLSGPAEAIIRFPDSNPEVFANRFAPMMRNRFSSFEILVRGRNLMHFPPDSTLDAPPAGWKQADGLVLKGGRLYAWVHAVNGDNDLTLMAPVTHDLLSRLVPGLGDVDLAPYTAHSRDDLVPPKENAFDFSLSGFRPVTISQWDSPQTNRIGVLLVQTRLSAVLGTVFGQGSGARPLWGCSRWCWCCSWRRERRRWCLESAWAARSRARCTSSTRARCTSRKATSATAFPSKATISLPR